MKRFIICLLLLLQTFFAAYASAAPAIPPRPAAGSGIYVQDYAGVISEEDKQQILSLGAELDNKTSWWLRFWQCKSLKKLEKQNWY